ncbi:MAG TPA: LytTR family DNA-binding domain-containing protein [Saprospiraceae bacterium]|nr:LytTR family DNA-binding domain-containing protein [Saprospiraceae bacterium]HRG66358.1 LytTR family DNA-binding domain-containing protein [Saprospiraceae bacterium]
MSAISHLSSNSEATIINLNPNAHFQLVKNSNPGIFVINQGARKKICVNEIILIKAAGNYSYIILDNHQSILTSKTIKYWADKFNSAQLLRIHKTYLINAEKVIEMKMGTQQLLLAESHTAVYSRGMRKQLLNYYQP